MQPGQWLFGTVFTCLIACLFGCGSAPEPAGNGPAADESAVEATDSDVHKTYALDQLPAAGEKIPPADQGRVVITLPDGWKTLQRNPKYLVAIIPEDSSASKLPRITVSVADAPAEAAENTTAANASVQAAALQAAEGKKFIESYKPLGLGDHVWIRHVRSAKQSGGEPAAIQSLQTVRDGRLYAVELTVEAKDNPKSSKPPIIYQKSLEAHRNFAYATAAHMVFPKAGDTGSSPPASLPTKDADSGEAAKPEAGPPEEAQPEKPKAP